MSLDLLDILILIFGLIGGIAMFFRPEWGLLVLVLMIYTRFSDVMVNFHELPSIAKLFVPFLLLVILARWALYGKRLDNWQPAAIILASYGVLGLLSMLYAAEPARVQDALIGFAKDAIILLAIVILIQRGKSMRYAIWAILAGAIFLGTIGVYQYLTNTYDNDYWGFGQSNLATVVSDTGEKGQRLGGPGVGPNGFGRYLLLAVPLALDRFWNEKKKYMRLLAAWALAVAVLALIFTFSRGAFLGLVAALIFMFIFRPPKFQALVLTGLLAIALVQFVPPKYVTRLTELQELLPGNIESQAAGNISFRGRISENRSAWMMFLDNPILGVGLNHFNYHYQEYAREIGLDPRSEERSPHNLFLEIMSELGVLGLIWFIALQWVAFSGLFRARKAFLEAGMRDYAGISLAIAAAIVGFLVTGIFLHNTHARFFWLIYGLALSMPQVARNELAHITTAPHFTSKAALKTSQAQS